MTAPIIDPERLRQMRKLCELTQDELAQKAQPLNKQRVYQLESRRCRVRKGTLERLAIALRVEPGVLTGEKPIPKAASRVTASPDGTRLNVRVGASIRNAFLEVSEQYGVPVRWIAQIAPLLFVIVAEASLKRRRKKVEELKAERDRYEERISDLGLDYLDFPTNTNEENRIIYYEEESINRNDLFGLGGYNDYGGDDLNPFLVFVKELTKDSDTRVSLLGPKSIEYRVCGTEATTLAKGEEPEEPEEPEE